MPSRSQRIVRLRAGDISRYFSRSFISSDTPHVNCFLSDSVGCGANWDKLLTLLKRMDGCRTTQKSVILTRWSAIKHTSRAQLLTGAKRAKQPDSDQSIRSVRAIENARFDRSGRFQSGSGTISARPLSCTTVYLSCAPSLTPPVVVAVLTPNV